MLKYYPNRVSVHISVPHLNIPAAGRIPGCMLSLPLLWIDIISAFAIVSHSDKLPVAVGYRVHVGGT